MKCICFVISEHNSLLSITSFQMVHFQDGCLEQHLCKRSDVIKVFLYSRGQCSSKMYRGKISSCDGVDPYCIKKSEVCTDFRDLPCV